MKNNEYNTYKNLWEKWLLVVAPIAGIFALIFSLNLIVPFEGTKIVYAVEKAYKKVQSYHGIHEEVETNGTVEFSSINNRSNPKVKVPVDLEVVKGEQKNVDEGHSPWKLDPSYVAQVFVSLQISPEGITGEYPVKENQLKVIENNGVEAIIEISGDKIPTKRVYLKKLIRQDLTGIWTVVGYDPK